MWWGGCNSDTIYMLMHRKKESFFTSNQEIIRGMFWVLTRIYKNQQNPVSPVCICVSACSTWKLPCIHLHIKCDSLPPPDKSPRSTVLLHSAFLSVAHVHSNVLDTHTLHGSSWLTDLPCSFVPDTPAQFTTSHTHTRTCTLTDAQTHWHRLVNTHSTSKQLEQLKT